MECSRRDVTRAPGAGGSGGVGRCAQMGEGVGRWSSECRMDADGWRLLRRHCVIDARRREMQTSAYYSAALAEFFRIRQTAHRGCRPGCSSAHGAVHACARWDARRGTRVFVVYPPAPTPTLYRWSCTVRAVCVRDGGHHHAVWCRRLRMARPQCDLLCLFV